MKEVPERGRLAAFACLLLPVLLAVSTAAEAVEMEGLYSVEVDMESVSNSRERAYEEALAEVLVRVTGSQSARSNPELMDLFPDPSRYVLQFARAEDDVLIVTMDGEAIAELLQRAGYSAWSSDRPLTLVWLAVEWAPGERELIEAADPDGLAFGEADRAVVLRRRIERAAARRGIPIRFPRLDAEDRAAVSASDVWGGFDEALLRASRRYGSASILVGRVRAANPEQSRWNYYYGSQRLAWNGAGDVVIDQLADALAEQFAVSGSARPESILLTVSGVDSVTAFGEISRLINGISAVRTARIDTVAGDEIRYRVEVRGGRESLAAGLDFSGLLDRADAVVVGDYSSATRTGEQLRYRYRGSGPDTLGLETAPRDPARPPDEPADPGR